MRICSVNEEDRKSAKACEMKQKRQRKRTELSSVVSSRDVELGQISNSSDLNVCIV